MIKKITTLLCLSMFAMAAMAQVNIYDTKADAQADLKKAIERAKVEGKHVFVQVGGNWCPWCVRFHNLTDTNAVLKNTLETNFVVVRVNYSKENKNEAALEQLEFPQRFGYPVFVILNAEGKRIHTQSSGYLEQGKGYDEKAVNDFLKAWTPAAVNPETYKKK
ncbi:thioredoxin family protein [Williamwhitmania taraxaci]|uniref:Thioredoxin-related protein n=1 Tax=Williamwhitmania taraxaci TaxID=1640674 RepID=A0A1G6Q6M1_9BACT|nr:thioredoxin family protein [Williamwhitmania taraxaci]SDC87968.1 Thioredoxin-related protein [Williamwhitmania taraxaci]